MTVDVKHYQDCEQLFMSVGQSYLVEALLVGSLVFRSWVNDDFAVV